MLKSGLLISVVIASLGGLTFATNSPETELVWPLLAGGLAFLIPAGFTLLASGGMPEEKAAPTAMMGLAATGLAIVGYLACGFALQFGGIGLVSDLPGLGGLIWEWSPLDATWGTGWGALGLRGFFLQKGADTPLAYALFFSQLPLVITACGRSGSVGWDSGLWIADTSTRLSAGFGHFDQAQCRLRIAE